MKLADVPCFLRDRLSTDEVDKWASRLPAIEVDIARWTLAGERQNEIAERLGWSQSAVHHRLAKLLQRLDFLREQPEIDPARFDRDLAFLSDRERTFIRAYYACPSQSGAARLVGTSQGILRHHLKRIIAKLEQVATKQPAVRPYARAFRALFNRPNILTTFDQHESLLHPRSSPHALVLTRTYHRRVRAEKKKAKS